MKDAQLINAVPGLNEKTVLVAEKLYYGYKQDYCYPYSHFADDGVTLEEAKAFIQALKKWGLVKLYRGLMDDDGRVAGSGFAISCVEAFHLIELALYRYHYNDRPVGRSSDFVPKQISIGGYTYRLMRDGDGTV